MKRRHISKLAMFSAYYARGFSLIEMMIALAIASFLVLGLVQVFSASRNAYRLSEGVSRVQENGRFAIDLMARDLRMSGHFGCVNDQALLQSGSEFFVSHLNATNGPLDFTQAIQAYEASSTGPTGTISLSSPSGGWNPSLPAYLTDLSPKPSPGSDIIVVKYFNPLSAPVTALTDTSITVDADRWGVFTQDGLSNPGLFGLSDCVYADVFQAKAIDQASGQLTVGTGNLNNTVPQLATRYSTEYPGQTMLYRAEAVAFYVAQANDGEPTLYRARFNSAPGSNAALPQGEPEALVEGIENIQLVFGADAAASLSDLSGYISKYDTFSNIDPQMVGVVKIGVLARSPDRANAAQPESARRQLSALGTKYTVPDDGRYRAVYESTVAMRNRLYGN